MWERTPPEAQAYRCCGQVKTDTRLTLLSGETGCVYAAKGMS
jgi:hypothetical protein